MSTKLKPMTKVWSCQLNLDRNLGKTNPLNEDDLAEFVKLQNSKVELRIEVSHDTISRRSLAPVLTNHRHPATGASDKTEAQRWCDTVVEAVPESPRQS